MSSESKDHKPESVDPGPSSGSATRQSARAPTVRGEVRDAIASVHNLAALLRSMSVKYKVILDLLPELKSSADVLRDAFARVSAGVNAGAGQSAVARVGSQGGDVDAATPAVGAFGVEKVRELHELLDATALANEERDDLTVRARALADELEVTSDLLALLERAAEPVRTHVSVRLILREIGRLWGGGRGRDIGVRFDDSAPELSIDADPYVVGPLLSLLLSIVHATGANDVVVRAAGVGSEAVLTVEPAGPGEAGLRTIPVRALPPVAPTLLAAHRVASRVGAVLQVTGSRAELRLPQGLPLGAG
jgi:hypothetical protein